MQPRTKRQHVKSGARWESTAGYSRAVRVGNTIAVSGTSALDERGCLMCVGDAYGQAMRIFDIIDASLGRLGSSLDDVIRSRIYVTDMSHFDEISRAHLTRLGRAAPAATCVQVSRLVDGGMLVEIEVDAIASGDR